MKWLLLFNLWYPSQSMTTTIQPTMTYASCRKLGEATVRFAKKWEGAGVKPSFQCVKYV